MKHFNFIRKLYSNNSIKRSVKLHSLFVSWKKKVKFPKIHQIMYDSIIRFYYRKKKKKPQILNIISTETLKEYWQCRLFLQNFVLPHQAVKF